VSAEEGVPACPEHKKIQRASRKARPFTVNHFLVHANGSLLFVAPVGAHSCAPASREHLSRNPAGIRESRVSRKAHPLSYPHLWRSHQSSTTSSFDLVWLLHQERQVTEYRTFL
jgi:hypothetical protein